MRRDTHGAHGCENDYRKRNSDGLEINKIKKKYIIYGWGRVFGGKGTSEEVFRR